MTYNKTKYFEIVDDGSKKTSELMDEMRSKFKVWSWKNNDEFDKDFPAPKKSTTRYFNKTVKPNKDLMNKSAEDLEKEGIECITLRERLIMELQYFKETRKRLDVNNITLCAGSRDSVGLVPSVDRRRGGGVLVDGYYPQDRHEVLGARRAVSLKPSSSCILSSLLGKAKNK